MVPQPNYMKRNPVSTAEFRCFVVQSRGFYIEEHKQKLEKTYLYQKKFFVR